MELKELETMFSNIEGYQGYCVDKEKLLESVSGGAASILSEEMIRKGGVVFGVAYSQDFRSAEYVLAENLEQLQALKGSKYIPAKKHITYKGRTCLVFEAVKEILEEKRPVLFVGLGCEIGALKNYLATHDSDDSNLYTIDLICHGPTMEVVQERYVDYLERKFKSNIVKFNIRHKKESFSTPYIHVEFANGKVWEEYFYGSDYAYAFHVLARKSCYKCHFKGQGHMADITIGDYWGIDENMDGYNVNGVSVFLCRTEKGEELIKEIPQAKFRLTKADVRHILQHNPMYHKSRELHEKRDIFEQYIKNNGLHSSVIKTQGLLAYYDNKLHLVRKVKKVLKIFSKRKGS